MKVNHKRHDTQEMGGGGGPPQKIRMDSCGTPRWCSHLSIQLLVLAQVSTQGQEIQARIKLCAQHRVCLSFFLFLPLPLSPLSVTKISQSLKKKKEKIKNKKECAAVPQAYGGVQSAAGRQTAPRSPREKHASDRV